MNKQEAIDFVDRYLQLSEDRDLAGALECWDSSEINMIFPGGKKFSSFDDLLLWASHRYKWVKKFRDTYSVDLGEEITVVSRGRIYGENLFGVPFENVRYVDVFTIKNGLLTQQDVWNDFGEGDLLSRKK